MEHLFHKCLLREDFCKPLPAGFANDSFLYTNCQHLEDSDVTEWFSCYWDDWGTLLKSNRSSSFIYIAAFAGINVYLPPGPSWLMQPFLASTSAFPVKCRSLSVGCICMSKSTWSQEKEALAHSVPLRWLHPAVLLQCVQRFLCFTLQVFAVFTNIVKMMSQDHLYTCSLLKSILRLFN